MIRMGMIGCGTMSRAFLNNLHPLADRLRFTAFVDVERERAAAAGEDRVLASNPLIAQDYHEIIDEVDAVILALPHDLHYEVARTFLAANKHVLLEKPIAITEPECLDLIKLADASAGRLMIGYVMRFNPLWQEMGRLIREKVYGTAFQVSIWTEQYTDLSRGAWLGDAKRVGGGQLFSHGCHYIDLLLNFLGNPLNGSHVGTNLGTPWMEMEGTSNVSIRFENGALGYHFGTWGARGSKLGYAVHAHCTQGMLEMDFRNNVIRLWRNPKGGDLPALEASLPEGSKLESDRSAVIYETPKQQAKNTAQEVAHFLDCIAADQEPLTNARMATQSLRVIWRLYEAERRGEVADLRGLGLDQFSAEPDPILAAWGVQAAFPTPRIG